MERERVGKSMVCVIHGSAVRMKRLTVGRLEAWNMYLLQLLVIESRFVRPS